MDVLDVIMENTKTYFSEIPKEKQKKIGQFYTDKTVACFMASLFYFSENSEIHVLDPGAGSGILSAAFLISAKSRGISNIVLDVYENDPDIIPLLSKNLMYVKKELNLPVQINIFQKDYILSNNDLKREPEEAEKYDYVISNPPYNKLHISDPKVKNLRFLCNGVPNVYFLFMAVSLWQLKPGREMVYLVPRSWASGLYFKNFRKYLFNNGSIEHVHLFNSRKNVFGGSVLQEVIIVKIKKKAQSDSFKISSSEDSELDKNSEISVNFSDVVVSPDRLLMFPLCSSDYALIKQINRYQYSLNSFGYAVKSGLIVFFRNKDFIFDSPGKNRVPIIKKDNFKNGEIVVPCSSQKYVSCSRKGLVQKSCFTVFIRRIAPKEEPVRIRPAIYDPLKYPDLDVIGSDLNILFINEANGMISKEFLMGFYVLMNSAAYNRYYTIMDGTTNVNSCELNLLPLPTKEKIEEIGKFAFEHKIIERDDCDAATEKFLNLAPYFCKSEKTCDNQIVIKNRR